MVSSISSKKKSTWGIIVVKSNSFVRFLEEIEDIKNHFEINWPLHSGAKCLALVKKCCHAWFNQNSDSSLLTLTGFHGNEAKYFFFWKKNLKWPTQKIWDFQNRQFSIFLFWFYGLVLRLWPWGPIDKIFKKKYWKLAILKIFLSWPF